MRKQGWRRQVVLISMALAMSLLCGCASVVARVNGADITVKEFHGQLERRAGLQVLTELVVRRLVLERAKADGCEPTKDEILAEFNKQKKDQFGGDETKMRSFMRDNGLDDKAMMDEIRLQLAMYKLQTKGVKADDAALKQFFDENHEKLFDKPERYTFRMIGVPTEDQAKKALAELNGTNKTFEDVVSAYSKDQSAQNGGLVEEMPAAQIEKAAPKLAQALSALKENGITQEPINQSGSFFIVKLVKHLKAEPAKYEDAATKEAVKTRFLGTKAKDQRAMLEEMTKSAKLQVLDDRFKAPLEKQFGLGPAAGAPGVPGMSDKGPEIAPPTHIDEGAVPPADAAAPAGGAPKGGAPKGGEAPKGAKGAEKAPAGG